MFLLVLFEYLILMDIEDEELQYFDEYLSIQ